MNSTTMQALTDIPETMLITLWAKAQENHQKNPIISDKKALEIMGHIDYDFGKFKQSKFSQVGICTRAKLIDDEALSFIQKNPNGIIIQIGAGLDTRFHRLGCPKSVLWYDLDVPEAMAYRQTLIAQSPNTHYLAYSMLDKAWLSHIHYHQPVLIIIEGVLMYFDEQQVRQFFMMLGEHFKGAEVVFDMLYYKGVGNAKKSDAVGKLSGNAQYRWSLLNSQEIESYHHRIHFIKEYYMSDYYGNRCPFAFNVLYKLPYFYKHFNQRVVKVVIE